MIHGLSPLFFAEYLVNAGKMTDVTLNWNYIFNPILPNTCPSCNTNLYVSSVQVFSLNYSPES
jgi:hypothetical protein